MAHIFSRVQLNMIRFGEPYNKNTIYTRRPGVYAIITVKNQILLTFQDNENQLPGGGIDKNEGPLRALYREVMEETGWIISIQKKLGTYQKFIFMPEYNLWAQKICSVYVAKGIYPISEPTENNHFPFIADPAVAARILHSPADRNFVKEYFQI